MKSRTFGSTTWNSLSKNAYARTPRSVTLQPTGSPLVIPKSEMLRLARVTIGRWPVILARSFMQPSSTRGSSWASLIPMLITTFSTRGTSMMFV